MVIFLLLLILAVLLVGADAVKGFAFGLSKFAGLVLVVAIVFGLSQKLPAWVWGVLVALVIAAFLTLVYMASQWPAQRAEMEARNKAHREAYLAQIRARMAAEARSKAKRVSGKAPSRSRRRNKPKP